LSAFAYIDNDKDGFITREDLRIFLTSKDEYFIGNMIEEADYDCDGGLTYDEFNTLMGKILKNI
jgi:Ca2+-binding EF-hand superfamily protein